jgi:nitrite reductase/ring-hydroxylating ferredoxin subunit
MAAHERVIAAGADLVDGGPGVRFTFERDGRELAGFAIRYDGQVHAYANDCAHRAVELDWLPGAFFDAAGAHLVCSMHGALYEPHTGRCVAGPCAGASLARLPVRERGEYGNVVLIEGEAGTSAPPALERGWHG